MQGFDLPIVITSSSLHSTSTADQAFWKEHLTSPCTMESEGWSKCPTDGTKLEPLAVNRCIRPTQLRLRGFQSSDLGQQPLERHLQQLVLVQKVHDMGHGTGIVVSILISSYTFLAASRRPGTCQSRLWPFPTTASCWRACDKSISLLTTPQHSLRQARIINV
jgi:hypothetical protein